MISTAAIGKGLTFLEGIEQFMLQAEQQVTAQGAGTTKKAIVVGLATAAINDLGLVTTGNAADAVNVVSQGVEIVGFLKGLFTKHKAPSPVTGPAAPIAPVSEAPTPAASTSTAATSTTAATATSLV